MAEFSGYMYGSFAPMPSIYRRAAREKKAAEEDPATQSRKPPKVPLGLRRAQSANRAGKKDKKDGASSSKSFASRFRGHTRTQSGSSASFSSHEEASTPRGSRASSSPVRTSKDLSVGGSEPRARPRPTLQTQLYPDNDEEEDEDNNGDQHDYVEPAASPTQAPAPHLPGSFASRLRKPTSPTGTSKIRKHGMPTAPLSGPWDDVSPYSYFHFGQASFAPDRQRPPTSQRRSTEPSHPPSAHDLPQQPPPSTPRDREREQRVIRGRSASGASPGVDGPPEGRRPNSSSDRQTRPPSRGRATLERFHVPRLPFSLTSTTSSSTTPTPTSEQTPSTPTQAQAQHAPPFPMDAPHGAALTIWDQPKIPMHQHRSPDHSSANTNNPHKSTTAASPVHPKERTTYGTLASPPPKITPTSISVTTLTEHITAASVAVHAAMAASSPYGSKNASNPSIDNSLTGNGRGSTSTSLSRIPSSPSRPFTLRQGRTYLADPSLPYPLPVDLSELHRQSLRTLLQIQVFGAPICSSAFASRPPARVLEVGCGSGFWSMMCHRYFSSRGHSNISFVGMDVAPLAPTGSSNDSGGAAGGGKPDRDMKWRFVQHDMRDTPWPFPEGEFDLVMAKEVFMGITGPMQQSVVDEYLRLLRPGGVLEIWESDHQVRMLRPHAPVTKKKQTQPTTQASARRRKAAAKAEKESTDEEEDDTTGDSTETTETEDDDEDDEDETSSSSSSSSDDEASAATSIGAYVMTANTPLSAPLNSYLVEFNTWINRALQARDLSAVPCTILGPLLLQEADELMEVRSRRLAIPLAEVRWEREGVGGVVTKDGKSYIDSGRARREAVAKGKAAAKSSKRLTAGQAAVRRTAMLTVVQLVQSLEPLLRESSGKSQDEWDGWMGKMTNDLMRENGAGCGECLEVGAWWARKRGQRPG